MRTLFLKLRLGRLGRHVDAGAGRVELPAVVDAAQAVLLVTSEEHRGAAVRAGVGDDADLAGGGRKAMRFSPSSRMRSGGQSGAGSSSESGPVSSTGASGRPSGSRGRRDKGCRCLSAEHGFVSLCAFTGDSKPSGERMGYNDKSLGGRQDSTGNGGSGLQAEVVITLGNQATNITGEPELALAA